MVLFHRTYRRARTFEVEHASKPDAIGVGRLSRELVVQRADADFEQRASIGGDPDSLTLSCSALSTREGSGSVACSIGHSDLRATIDTGWRTIDSW